jgi:hypothetical protein
MVVAHPTTWSVANHPVATQALVIGMSQLVATNLATCPTPPEAYGNDDSAADNGQHHRKYVHEHRLRPSEYPPRNAAKRDPYDSRDSR